MDAPTASNNQRSSVLQGRNPGAVPGLLDVLVIAAKDVGVAVLLAAAAHVDRQGGVRGLDPQHLGRCMQQAHRQAITSAEGQQQWQE